MHKFKNIVMTKMLRQYLIKLVVRVSLFCASIYAYLYHKDELIDLLTHRYKPFHSPYGVNLLEVLWLVFMVMMLRHLFPTEKITMALKKEKKEHFVKVENYEEINLLRFVQLQNLRSWHVLLIWLSFNAIFALLFLFNIIDSADMLMLTVFYFLSDYICILFFCPFQTFVLKNKCCVNCRIYDWGHFMMFTPMLFIKNFFSWSLFFTSLIVLIRWEIVYAKHPERFWFGSNQTLQCANCKDKTCQIKNALKSH